MGVWGTTKYTNYTKERPEIAAVGEGGKRPKAAFLLSFRVVRVFRGQNSTCRHPLSSRFVGRVFSSQPRPRIPSTLRMIVAELAAALDIAKPLPVQPRRQLIGLELESFSIVKESKRMPAAVKSISDGIYGRFVVLGLTLGMLMNLEEAIRSTAGCLAAFIPLDNTSRSCRWRVGVGNVSERSKRKSPTKPHRPRPQEPDRFVGWL